LKWLKKTIYTKEWKFWLLCRHFYVCDQNHTIAHFLFNIFLSTKDLIAFDLTHFNISWPLSSICVFAKLKMYWPQNSCTINMLQCLLELASTTTSHVLVQICLMQMLRKKVYECNLEKYGFLSAHSCLATKTHCLCLLCSDSLSESYIVCELHMYRAQPQVNFWFRFFVLRSIREYLNILVHSLHNMSDADAEKKSIWMQFRKIWFSVSTFMSVHKTHCVCLLCSDSVIH
jgi:hypothetical protein